MYKQGCLPNSALQSLLRGESGELSTSERKSAEDHLSLCPHCRSRLSALIGDLETVAQANPEPAPAELKRLAREMVPGSRASNNPGQRSSTRLWLPLAAAVLMAIGLGAIWRPATPDREPGVDVLRSLPTQARVELDLPLSGAVAVGERTLFRWQPIESAGRYDFEVVNEIGDVLFEARTTQPSIELPRGNLALEAGSDYYWSVRATLRDGTVVESELRGVSF